MNEGFQGIWKKLLSTIIYMFKHMGLMTMQQSMRLTQRTQNQHNEMIVKLLLTHAQDVMKNLGIGHKEVIYAKALNVSLNKYMIPHRTEVDIPIMFMGQSVGHGRADLIIDNLIVEIKALAKTPKEAMAQLQKYIINLSHLEQRAYRGVIVNFCQTSGNVVIYSHEDVSSHAQNNNLLLENAPTKTPKPRGRPPKVKQVDKMDIDYEEETPKITTRSRFFVNKSKY